MISVALPEALTALFPGAPARIELDAATVDELLTELDRRWPGMRDRLRDTTPKIRKHINVFVDGRRATLATELPPGAAVLILPAMRG